MTVGDFKSWAISQGWEEDRFGHLHKRIGEKEYRFKLQATSVRFELKVKMPDSTYSKGNNEWVRIRSNYYSKLTVNPETNKLEGMVR